MSASPKTTAFLKECMADSLLQIMKKKQFDKITINEITQAAGVNRSTWFRNFNSKNEALTFKLIQLWNRWADDHDMGEHYRYTLDNADMFFAFNASIQEILLHIYREELQACIYDTFLQIMNPQHNNDDPVACYEARFYSYGLFGLLEEWIKRDFDQTPEQLTALFQKMIKRQV